MSYDKTTDNTTLHQKAAALCSEEFPRKEGYRTGRTGTAGHEHFNPAVYNGRAYVGVSGEGQFAVYNGHNITVIDLEGMENCLSCLYDGIPSDQWSCIYASADDGYNYIYFFENMTPVSSAIIKINRV